ncbi:NmrA family NAD(P)-binding protein [Microbacteriaceae bacterium 4G12]
MLPALEYAKGAGVRHIVFLSLQGAERNRFVPHATIEQWLREQDMTTYTFVRAFFFMQNLSTTHAADIRDRSEIVVPLGRVPPRSSMSQTSPRSPARRSSPGRAIFGWHMPGIRAALCRSSRAPAGEGVRGVERGLDDLFAPAEPLAGGLR